MSKKMVLTENVCQLLEDVRFALMIYTGKDVRLQHVQFDGPPAGEKIDSGCGFVTADGQPKPVTFVREGEHGLIIRTNYFFYGEEVVLNAQFSTAQHRAVRVVCVEAKKPPMWYSGTDLANRIQGHVFRKDEPTVTTNGMSG